MRHSNTETSWSSYDEQSISQTEKQNEDQVAPVASHRLSLEKLPEAAGPNTGGVNEPFSPLAAFRKSVVKLTTATRLSNLKSKQIATSLQAPSCLVQQQSMGSQVQTQQEGQRSGSKDHQANRRLVRLADPQSRLTFLKEHPFFQDTSPALRERLAPQLVRRSSEQRSTNVVQQGEEPIESMDYLFLTAPDINTQVEVIFDGQPIAILRGSAVFGQEVIFGVTTRFVFGVHVSTGSTSALWVIPRFAIMSVLQKDIHKGDYQVLKARAHATMTALLRNWHLQPTTHIRLRLFDNADHACKLAILQAMTTEIHISGSVIRRELEPPDGCLCIFRGKASVSIAGTMITELVQGAGNTAWSAWWGLVEMLGVSRMSLSNVVATTDCIVWTLSSDGLRGLRKQFPVECRLFDKVAEQNVQLLQPNALRISDAAVFQGCSLELTLELASAVTSRVCAAGTVLTSQDDSSTDFYFIARGCGTVRRLQAVDDCDCNSGRAGDKLQGDAVEHCDEVHKRHPDAEIAEGSVFGEATALGFAAKRTATVTCETICDVRILPGNVLVDILTRYPNLAPKFLKLADSHGFSIQDVVKDLKELLLFEELSDECLQRLNSEMSQLVTFRGQTIMEQRQECDSFYILLHGIAQLEIDKEVIAEIRPPALLGEMALLQSGAKSSFTVRSQGVCSFKAIKASQAMQVFKQFPEDDLSMKKLAQDNLESLRDILLECCFGRSDSKIGRIGMLGGGRPKHNEENAGAVAAKEQEVHYAPTCLERLFHDSDPKFLAFITSGMKKAIYFANQVMLRERDEGNFAILVQTGTCIVEVGGIRVGEVKSVGLIGEAVLLGESARRTATVRAVGLVSAFTLSQSVMLAAFDEFPLEKEKVKVMTKLRTNTNKVLTGVKAMDTSSTYEIKKGNHVINMDNALFGKSIAVVEQQRLSMMRRVSVASGAQMSRRSSAVSSRRDSTAVTARRPSRLISDRVGTSRSASPAVGQDEQEDDAPNNISTNSQSVSSRPVMQGLQQRRSTVHCITSFRRMSREENEQSSVEGMMKSGQEPAKVSFGDKPFSARETSQGQKGGESMPFGKSTLHFGDMLATSDSVESDTYYRSLESKQCKAWADRRSLALREAPLRRDRRLAKSGGLLPLVPNSRGYQVFTSANTSVPASPLAGRPWKASLRRAQGVYEPPVWHEVFGEQ